MTGRNDRKPYTQPFRDGFRGWWMEGGRRRYTPVLPSAQQAHDEAVRHRQRIADRKRAGQVRSLTLAEGIELVRQVTKDRRRRAGTVRYLEGTFSLLLQAFGPESPLDEFTPQHVNNWIRFRLRTVKPNTVRHNLTVFSRIFNVAIAEGLITTNPVRAARAPQVEDTKIDVFAWPEAVALIAKLECGRTRDLATLLLHTGLRRAEVARLSRADVQPATITVQGKTGGRVVPITKATHEVVARTVPLPGNTEDKRIDHVRRFMERARKKLREPRWHAHALRHTFASELARLGVPEHIIGDLLGHKRRRSSITSRYVSAFGPEYHRAVSLLGGDQPWSTLTP